MAKSDSERSKQYAKSEKGKEAEARKQARKKAERKKLALLRLALEQNRRFMTAAKFSDRYTVFTSLSGRQKNSVLKTVKGVNTFVLERFYRDKPADSQCAQGGIPRWSESILNPAYRKKHKLPTPQWLADWLRDYEKEKSEHSLITPEQAKRRIAALKEMMNDKHYTDEQHELILETLEWLESGAFQAS
jgi:hypothetical protein